MKKRADMPFDVEHFRKLKDEGKVLDIQKTFTTIFQSNHWTGEVSVSGLGSDDIQTAAIRSQLPMLINKYNVKTLLDLPCGDFNWLSRTDLRIESYIGGDIVPDIIDANNIAYKTPTRNFRLINIITDPLPAADLIFCRDCLVHFSNEDIIKSVSNIKRSGIPYLLTTTFTECKENTDIVTGDWRLLNLTLPPFNLPKPIEIINEECTEGNGTYRDKSLGLWRTEDIPDF